MSDICADKSLKERLAKYNLPENATEEDFYRASKIKMFKFENLVKGFTNEEIDKVISDVLKGSLSEVRAKLLEKQEDQKKYIKK